MSGMKPITREEVYLNKLAGEDQNTPEPVTREEQYLSRLCGADNIIPQTPETRREAYLAALCGEEVETPEPETRIEQYMNFAAGKSQSKPEKAITREEMYWDKYQGGAVPEEKTVQGDIIHITDATGDNAVALSVALAPTQDGTPWISDTLNTEPYLSRAAQNGNTADETIVGGTVAWNQLVQNGDFSDGTTYWQGLSSVTDGVAISSTKARYQTVYQSRQTVSGHKYLFSVNVTADSSRQLAIAIYIDNSAARTERFNVVADTFSNVEKIIVGDGNRLAVANWGAGETIIKIKKFMCIDLTQMFGSTIADYVYSLETATEGAGVAWLRSHGFVDDNYHAYNPGELISAKPTAKVVGDTTYALGGVDLRGLFKLDANNNLYCDGDVYTADGTITRKYKKDILDGTETWYSASNNRYYTKITDARPAEPNVYYPPFITNGPLFFSTVSAEWKGYINDQRNLVIYGPANITSVSEFKAYLSAHPMDILYELETPTTEQSTAYTNPQKAGEAESFVDARTEKVPVGHSTRYSAEYAINGFEGVTVHVSETQTGGTTYPVTFTSQGTVYGGTVDVVSGEMSITWAIADMGDLEWTQWATGYGYFEAYFNAYNTGEETFGLLTTSYPKGYMTDMSYLPLIASRTKQRGILVMDSRYNDVTAFKTAVTGQKVAYELSTPITATIDPTTISLNEGENYVWTEEGTTTLTYMARAAQRVLAMNRTLQKNLNAIELKKGGDLK